MQLHLDARRPAAGPADCRAQGDVCIGYAEARQGYAVCLSIPSLSLVVVVVVVVRRRQLPPPTKPVHRTGEAVHPCGQRSLEAFNRLGQCLNDGLLRLHVGAKGEELVLLEAQCGFAHLQFGHRRGLELPFHLWRWVCAVAVRGAWLLFFWK